MVKACKIEHELKMCSSDNDAMCTRECSAGDYKTPQSNLVG